ncbi:hypothetical protein SeLEV6574_g07815 [Synchytrium endobioticum]|uniref:Uncharacterized protein n=1 Tax=Synchytrium endobioticum TaxID=286115 RepID=A0A507CE94_9FUNG|nr:hypothetical protein SeLEV6574_g07815 [Synchytrium endobioticum]
MVFDGMISTNGTDVSVYLKHPNAHRRGSTRKSKAGLQAEVKQLYIDNHLQELRSTPNIVAIDPNKRGILYCQDRNSNSNLRYTSNQRATTASREKPRGPAMVSTLSSRGYRHTRPWICKVIVGILYIDQPPPSLGHVKPSTTFPYTRIFELWL